MRLSLLALFLCIWSMSVRSESLSVAVISDLNGRYGSVGYNARVASAIQDIIQREPDLVLSTGDMVAGQQPRPPLSQEQLEAMWEAFDTTVRVPLEAAEVPLLMTPGNHDASAYSAYALERRIFAGRFTQERAPLPLLGGGNYPFHYAFDYSGIRFISLDATRTDALNDVQLAWFKQQLVSRTEPAVPPVEFGHLPLQPVAAGREREYIYDPELEAQLSAVGAVYLSGHHHAYYPGHRGGMSMISAPNLGGNPRRLLGASKRGGFGYLWLTFHQGRLSDIELVSVGGVGAIPLPDRVGEGELQLRRLPGY